MTDDAIKADVVKRFHTIPGLGLSKAEVLFNSGFTTISTLKKSNVKDLSAVKGITPSLAKYIIREVRSMPDETPDDETKDVGASTDDTDSATISVSEVQPDEETQEDEEGEEDLDTEASTDPPEGEEGPGLFGGLISSIKSIFAPGPEPAEPTDTTPSGLTPEEIEAAKAVSTTESETEDGSGPEAPADEDPEPEDTKVEPEPSEASIKVDHGQSVEEAKTAEEPEEVTKGSGDEPSPEEPSEATPEAPERTGPTVGQTAMSIASDIKAKGLARIRALRERLASKKKDPETPPPAGTVPDEKVEEPEAGPDEKAEGPGQKAKTEEKSRTKTKADNPKDENKELVDNVIKDLDLDKE